MAEKEPKTAEEINARMNALVAALEERGEGENFTTEEAEEYKGLEKKLYARQETEGILRTHKAFQAPRVSVLPPAPKGDQALEYAFEHYLRTGQVNADMAGREVNNLPLTYDQTLTTTAGGYLIPTTTEQRLVNVMKNYGGIAKVCDQLPTSAGNPINYPTNDDTANSAEIDA